MNRVRPFVNPQIEEEGGSILVVERRIPEGAWEYAHLVYMCFVNLEKVYDRNPREILWEVLQEYGVGVALLKAIQFLYTQSESCVWVLHEV